MAGESLGLGRGEAEAELGAAPEDVFGGAGVFVADQPVDFALGQAGAEVFAGVFRQCGRVGTVGADQAAGGVGIPGNWIMPVMSMGQVAEILTMFILGATLARLGSPLVIPG